MKASKSVILYTACLFGLVLSIPSVASSQSRKDDIKALAVEYVRSHEPLLASAGTNDQRFRLLYYLCPAALSAGEVEKARRFASSLLEIAPELEKQPGFGAGNRGAATHIAKIVLGRIALDEGKLAEAEQDLLAAASIKTGNAPLMSFGPDMLLAKRLIEKGEVKPAVEYLDLCSKFWTNEKGRVTEWKQVINVGGMPGFGANLSYYTDGWRFAK